jgi:hypothetical protein
MKKDIYYENPSIRGRCTVCGDTGPKRQKKNPKYFKPYYYSKFVKTGWSRGDDEYLGKVCKECMKKGL